jgi:hypothetical protein
MNFEYSPLGYTTLKGSTNKKQQFAKATLGAMATIIAGSFAAMGNTTWSAPTKTKEKDEFYASGKKAYSVKVGDKWIPFQYFGPFAWTFGLPAAAKHYADNKKDEENNMDVAVKTALSGMKQISDQTFMQGLGNLVGMLSGDPEYTWSKNLGFTASGAIPYSGLQRYINQIIDPTYRKTKDFWDSFKQNIVGTTTKMEAYKDAWTGEDSKRLPINKVLPYDIGIEKERPANIPANTSQPTIKLTTNAQKEASTETRSVWSDFYDGEIELNDVTQQLTKLGADPVSSRLDYLAKSASADDKYAYVKKKVEQASDTMSELRSLQEQKVLTETGVDNLFKEELITPSERAELKDIETYGLNPDEYDYHYYASLDNDVKYGMLRGMLEGKSEDEKNNLLFSLAERSKLGQPFVSDSMTNLLLELGVITPETRIALRNANNASGSSSGGSGSGSKRKLRISAVPTIKLSQRKPVRATASKVGQGRISSLLGTGNTIKLAKAPRINTR